MCEFVSLATRLALCLRGIVRKGIMRKGTLRASGKETWRNGVVREDKIEGIYEDELQAHFNSII